MYIPNKVVQTIQRSLALNCLLVSEQHVSNGENITTADIVC